MKHVKHSTASDPRGLDRRAFVKSSAAIAGGVILAPGLLARGAWAGGQETIRIGVIGSGDRGTGAAVNALEADPAVRIVALADLFPERVEKSRALLAGHPQHAARATVEPDRCYTGFDAYRALLRSDLDAVILTTPPHFRPAHFEAAVNAGKHIFAEKPVAVDPAGIRRFLAAAKEADRKGLSVVAGTQRRHDPAYRALIERIRSGDLGTLVSGACWWNQGGLWVHQRKPEYSDTEWQVRNWLYFCWLSGDHIVEQHVHNIDVINWAMGTHPVKALGMGGRQVRTGPEYGNIFDHFTVQYEYPGGALVTSQCRQIDGCASRVNEMVAGARGRARFGAARLEGDSPFKFEGERPNPYVQEHIHLIQSIRGEGTRLNEAREVAHSTLTAIMGRLSAYTGQEVTWEQAMSADLCLDPGAYEFGPLEVDPVPVPGRTKLPAPPAAPPTAAPAATPAAAAKESP
ncbi:MAG: Gfo/Idh/MocA family oxidoreductase [Phycisphaerales bacterium]